MITKRRFFAAASLALCMTAFDACVKEDASESQVTAEGLVEMTFEAPSPDVKSTFDETARKICWETTDKVAIYDGTAKRQFSVVSVEDGVATLKGYVEEGATEFYAVYPYSAAGDELPEDGAVNICLPQEQTLAEGKNFDENAFVTVGKVEDGSIAFKNVVSLLKVRIPAEVTSVKLISYSTEKFAGVATAKTDRTTTAGDAASVVLKPAGETFTAGDYYMALLPTTFAKGFRVVYEQASQIGVSKTSAEVVFPVNGGFSITGSTPSWIPTVITNEAQLRNYFADQDLFGTTEVKLGQDIALASEWTPVALTGKLDGAGYTISGLDVKVTDAGTHGAMFKTIDTDASLKNVTVEGAISLSTSAATSYAGLVGEFKGTMYKVINKASVTAASTGGSRCYPGGLVGIVRAGSIVECENYGDVTLSSASCVSFIGGLVGVMSPAGLVQNSKNYGIVTSESAKMEGIGGIVGIQQGGTLDKCTNEGTLVPTAAAGTSYAGGITGFVQNQSTNKLLISECTNNGEIQNITALKAAGGIVGVIHRYCKASSEINGCVNNVALTATIPAKEFYLGGIVGRMANPGNADTIGSYVNFIKGCKNFGNVSATRSASNNSALIVGGILSDSIGQVEITGNHTLAEQVVLNDVRNEGDRNSIVGGIVGRTDDTSETIVSSNVNKADVVGKITNSRNYAILSSGVIGRCRGPLVASDNMNFGDVSVYNNVGNAVNTGRNAFAGAIVGEIALTSEEATLTGNKTFGHIMSDSGRAGLVAGVINGTYTVNVNNSIVGGILTDPTNKYSGLVLTEETIIKDNMMISYYKNITSVTISNTTFGTAANYNK